MVRSVCIVCSQKPVLGQCKYEAVADVIIVMTTGTQRDDTSARACLDVLCNFRAPPILRFLGGALVYLGIDPNRMCTKSPTS